MNSQQKYIKVNYSIQKIFDLSKKKTIKRRIFLKIGKKEEIIKKEGNMGKCVKSDIE